MLVKYICTVYMYIDAVRPVFKDYPSIQGIMNRQPLKTGGLFTGRFTVVIPIMVT